ncbi:hypothetical protein P389DRAFT_85191 [Cystobasidium minutum MCA 4210]|uniref:uncharacterized protein n=1 Tax=Cystobasidium minutum MCA 4210 TaxID=1397322 RepID=UPI0034CFA9CB|eukprot:jgi/Rhomi1/85191/CE85190_524
MKSSVVAAILALNALSWRVTGLPAPQESGASATCDLYCNAVLAAGNACSDLPEAQQLPCICATSGFLTFAEACYSCDGGSIFGGSELYYISLAIEECGGTPVPPSSAASSGRNTSSTGSATNVAGGAQAVPVTEDPTKPISFEAWAPSGFSPTLTYRIEETGGVNTTIKALETLTVTTEGVTVTATVTAAFIMDASQVVQVVGNDGYDDYTFCKLVDATTGDCIELEYDGTSLTASTRYTLVGATSTWVAYPQETGTMAGSSSRSAGSVAASPTQKFASGTAAGGTVAGLTSSTAS